MTAKIIIGASADETRMGLVENGRLMEYLVERTAEQHLVGSIFKGRVCNVVRGIQAAFVDLGLEQNAFLYLGEAMDVTEGRLELREYAGTIGHDFSVTLNGRMLGAIMDNMDITIGNLVFDNSFLIVYEEKYLPLLTAMAVMVARELARDEDGGVSNRI